MRNNLERVIRISPVGHTHDFFLKRSWQKSGSIPPDPWPPVLHASYGNVMGPYQQIKETPVINYSTIKRIITSCQNYDPPVKDYITLHWSILPYQFRNPGSALWDGIRL